LLCISINKYITLQTDGLQVCGGYLIYTGRTELWEKLDTGQCWTKYEGRNGTGLDIRYEKAMTASPNRSYNGHHKATEEEGDKKYLEKQSAYCWSKVRFFLAMGGRLLRHAAYR